MTIPNEKLYEPIIAVAAGVSSLGRRPANPCTGDSLLISVDATFGEEQSYPAAIDDLPNGLCEKQWCREVELGNICKPITTIEELIKELDVFRPIAWRIVRRRLSSHDAEEVLQDITLRLVCFVQRGHSINKPRPYLVRCTYNQLKNWFRKKKLPSEYTTDIVDPTSREAKEMERRLDARFIVTRLLNSCSSEEKRCAMAYLRTGDNRSAVDYLLEQEGTPVARKDSRWERRYWRYNVAMARVRARGRQLFHADDAV